MEFVSTRSGTVGEGRGFGRTIGFPTINIPLTDTDLSGIYAAVVRVGGVDYPAAAYADSARGLLEAHLIDWTGDLYGQEVTILVGPHIRGGVTYPDELSLMTAIAADILQVRKLFDLPHGR